MKNVLISGGSGAIGSRLSQLLLSKSYNVSIITRSNSKKVNNINYINIREFESNAANIVSGYNVVINLAGAGIASKSWTTKYKNEIISSRAQITKLLAESIDSASNKPELFISASAIGFYGDRAEEKLYEDSKSGNGFLADVCKIWESSAQISNSITRKVICRIGIVLDKSSGALPKMAEPFKFYAGASLGSGKQWYSWIHIEDIINAFLFIIENDNVEGIVNFCSPNPLTNREFTNVLGDVLGKPSFMSVPKMVLKIMLGESSEMVLNSQRVVPRKLIESGFNFKYSNLKEALIQLLR